MKPLYGNDLVNELRRKSDKVKNRLWICVPYIGNSDAVFKILGKEWFENENVQVRLLTDISDFTAINTSMLKIFHERGDVKTLLGVHAKIYIIDDSALVTSANLTETAFSKRHEIGLFFDNATDIISLFETWWAYSEKINSTDTTIIYKPAIQKDETTKVIFPKIWDLPSSPRKITQEAIKYTNYDRTLIDYDDFVEIYTKNVQRIWIDDPIYLEIDGFFDYLFHKEDMPSNKFYEKDARELSERQLIREIKGYAKRYRDWENKQEYDGMEWRKRSSMTVQKFLSKRRINRLNFETLEQTLSCVNSMNYRNGLHKTRLLKNNSIEVVISAFYNLIHGQGTIASRVLACEKEVVHLGKSSINELIGCYYPDKYPLINRNSISGLRFFGFQSKL